MGLKPGVVETPGRLDILMEGPDGKSFGIPFDYPVNQTDELYSSSNIKSLLPQATVIPNDLRKKGVATEVYKAAEALTGRTILPDDVQTTAGFNLHSKRGLGKDFGLSEDWLETLLSEKDRDLRNSRKQTFMSAVGDMQNELSFPDSSRRTALNAALRKVGEDIPDVKGRTNLRTVLEQILDTSLNKANPVEFLTENAKKYGSRVKSVLPGVLAGGAGLAASGLAEAFDAEEAGRGSDKSMTDSQQRDLELTRDVSKDSDTLTQTRLRALQRMLGK